MAAAGSAQRHAPTLEMLFTEYSRTDARPGIEIELEARFEKIEYSVFADTLRALNAGKLEAGPGEVSQVINSVMDEDPQTQRIGQRAGFGRAGLVRQLRYADGVRAAGEDRNYRKRALHPPHVVANDFALSYKVVLSAEENLGEQMPVADNQAAIRVKLRVSYLLGSPAAWRIDMTATRQIEGKDARGLKTIVAAMFRPGATAENLLDLLGLDDADSETLRRYQFEMEIEYAGTNSQADDRFVPSHLKKLADELLSLANPNYLRAAAYQAELYRVAEYVVKDAPGLLRRFARELGVRDLTTPVKSLTRVEYKDLYPPTDFWTTDKADGIHAVASARGGRLWVLADQLREFRRPAAKAVSPGGAGKGGGPSSAARDEAEVFATIVAGELVGDAFYAYDVVAVRGVNVAGKPFGARHAHLSEAVADLQGFEGLRVEAKPYVHLTSSDAATLKAQFAGIDLAGRPYQTDGRILVKPGATFAKTKTFKWKSEQDTTIDFLVRRPPPGVMGAGLFADAPDCELHFLFVGITPQLRESLGLERCPGYQELFGSTHNTGSYAPIQFAPSFAPFAYLYQHPTARPAGAVGERWEREIDGRIVELRCGGGCAAAGGGADDPPNWEMVRVREDRARALLAGRFFGNSFKVAEMTWLIYVDPFPEEVLWAGAGTEYFSHRKSPVYVAPTGFTSFVKTRRIEAALSHAAWVVDLGVGRGQDLGRYLNAQVRNLVGVDRDRGALSELIQRKYDHAEPKKRRAGRLAGAVRGRTLALHALAADVGAPSGATLGKLRATVPGFPAGGADAVVANLFLHYLAGTVASLENFAALCRGLVRVGGVVVITAMFGDRVHALLEQESVAVGGAWTLRVGGAVKYSIRRDYASEELTAAGQQIGVVHPFSGGAYYEEFLLNVATLSEVFRVRGFAEPEVAGFETRFEDFKARNRETYGRLTDQDKKYLSLYGEIIFRRVE